MGGKLVYFVVMCIDVFCLVGYYGMGIEVLFDEVKQIKGWLVLYFVEQDVYCLQQVCDVILFCLCNLFKIELYFYFGVDYVFVCVGGMYFDKLVYLMVYECSIVVLKWEIGLNFDFFVLWDEYVCYEFDICDVVVIMVIMVVEFYVNYVLIFIGGVGQCELSCFYCYYFIYGNLLDMIFMLILWMVGVLQVVDEFVMCFIYSCEIDWLLFGVLFIGCFVEIFMFGVVCFCGDCFYYEYIYWDQVGVLVQIGLFDLQGLLVVGVESVCKLFDESLLLNCLMVCWVVSEGFGFQWLVSC